VCDVRCDFPTVASRLLVHSPAVVNVPPASKPASLLATSWVTQINTTERATVAMSRAIIASSVPFLQELLGSLCSPPLPQGSLCIIL
jgi:hypothetical protein